MAATLCRIPPEKGSLTAHYMAGTSIVPQSAEAALAASLQELIPETLSEPPLLEHKHQVSSDELYTQQSRLQSSTSASDIQLQAQDPQPKSLPMIPYSYLGTEDSLPPKTLSTDEDDLPSEALETNLAGLPSEEQSQDINPMISTLGTTKSQTEQSDLVSAALTLNYFVADTAFAHSHATSCASLNSPCELPTSSIVLSFFASLLFYFMMLRALNSISCNLRVCCNDAA